VIVLDTNVISALMRPVIDPAVAAYLQAQPPDTLFTASLCEAEIRYGIARLPQGRRRDVLEAAFQVFSATASPTGSWSSTAPVPSPMPPSASAARRPACRLPCPTR
jgi:predicted nucleic acid-binding protein